MTTTSTLWVRVPLSGGGEAVYELDRELSELPHYDSSSPDGMLPLRDVAISHGTHIATKSAGKWYVETKTGKAPFAYQTESPELIAALESSILVQAKPEHPPAKASSKTQQIYVSRMSRAQRKRYLDD